MNLYQKYNENSVPVVVHILLCALALAFWIIFTSLALPFLFVFNALKWGVAAWIVYNRIGKVLASQDAPFMHESEHNRNYCISLFMVKGTADIEKLQKLFDERVLQNNGHPTYKRLKKCIQRKYGRYVWLNEENFHISKHILCYEGPYPEDNSELEKIFGEIISKPMAKEISPWQVWMIPLKDGTRFAFLTRAHHIIGDGISMVNLFSKVMDDKPVLLKPTEKLLKKYKSISPLRRALHAFFTGPLTLLAVALSQSHNPFPRKDGGGEQKVASTEAISLSKIKDVKNKIGATINDVVTSCLAGAVRRYLIQTQGKCTEDVQIAVSINTRPPSMLLADNIPLENNSTGVFLTLPVATEDVLKRVHESKKRMDAIKSSSDFLVFGFIFNTVLANLPEFVGRFSVNSLNRHSCLIMSNVPGPLNKMVIGGDVVESMMCWPPLVGGIGMSVAIFSYADSLRLNVMVDTSAFPEPKVLTDFFQEEMDELFMIYAKKSE